jgi:hypothetical protein
VVSLQRIQRIHGYYRSLVPEAEQFFPAPPVDEEMVAAVESTGVRRTPLGLPYTAASMIAAVNSILGGVGLALLGGRLGGLGTGPAVIVGVAGTLVLYGLHLWYGVRRNAQVGIRPPPVRGRPGPDPVTLALHHRHPLGSHQPTDLRFGERSGHR